MVVVWVARRSSSCYSQSRWLHFCFPIRRAQGFQLIYLPQDRARLGPRFLFDLYTMISISAERNCLHDILMRYEASPFPAPPLLSRSGTQFATMTNVVDVYLNYLRRKVDSDTDRATGSQNDYGAVGIDRRPNGRHA